MASFKINEADLSFLSKHVNDEKFAVIFKTLQSATFDKAIERKSINYEIELTKNQSASLVDILSNILIENGLDINGEPNPLGLQIESIIDVFTDETGDN